MSTTSAARTTGRGIRVTLAVTITTTFVVAAALLLTGVISVSTTTEAQADRPISDRASSPEWEWIRSQMGSATPVTTESVIAGSTGYTSDWTGPVSGTFELAGFPLPDATNGSPVTIDSPAALDGTYRGTVKGHAAVAPKAGRWIINVLWRTGNGTTQAQLQTLVGTDSAFTLDLSKATAAGTGSWVFQILDATNGYAQEGETWPQPGTLPGLEVRAAVVTDTLYVINTQPARADFTFSFTSSRPGAKVFQLVDTASGSVLAEQAPDYGLVRSYGSAPESPSHGKSYSYDQALALITADSLGDEVMAGRLTDGLMKLQTAGGDKDGAFVTSAAVMNPDGAQLEYRTGNHSIATYALLRRARSMAPGDVDRPRVLASAQRGVDWLIAQQRTGGDMDGLVTGGYGAVATNNTFDPSISLPWASTEHNLDAWHTLKLAASVLDDDAAGRAAEQVEAGILGRLWDPATHQFLQGWQPDGADPTEMLDLDSWGAIFLKKVGRPEMAAESLAHAKVFTATDSGVKGYAPQPPKTTPLVWFEGSGGVAVAEHRLGRVGAADSTLQGLAPGQLASGAWPEATRADSNFDMSANPSVGATTWMLLAQQAVTGQATIWDD